VCDRPTQGLGRLPFGERRYDSDCGSEFSDDYDDDIEHYADEDESFKTDAFAQIQMLREEFEISLKCRNENARQN
jgi:hypothetical protein